MPHPVEADRSKEPPRVEDRPVLPSEIQTERLLLRPFRLDDVDDVLAYARDPEWSRYLRLLPRPYEREDAERFVARQILLEPTTHPAWALALDDAVVGGVKLRFAFEHRSVEIGYSLARSLWNRGLCTEAARAVVDAAFSTHQELNRLWARADVQNVASHRVMEKIGMTKEGVLRGNRVERGEAVDEACFSILRNEWTALTPRHRRQRLGPVPRSSWPSKGPVDR
jgi:ribosomal-protein-alanine N-acetyltransferase